MKAKTKETISRWVLVVAASVSLGTAVALVINPQFPYRSILIQEQILDATIGLFSVLSAGFIAAIALLYVNKQTQTYSWRRDQALKDIETIYEPLYQDVSEAAEDTEKFDVYAPRQVKWNSISNTYLGTKLGLIDKKLYRRLGTLFADLKNYTDRRSRAVEIVTEIAKKVSKPYLSESLSGEISTERRQEILDSIAHHLGYNGYIYEGFLKGKSVREWSALNHGDEEVLISWARQNLEDRDYSPLVKFTTEQIEAILNQTYKEAQDNVEISQFRDWGNALNTEAVQLQKELEKRILEPQLP